MGGWTERRGSKGPLPMRYSFSGALSVTAVGSRALGETKGVYREEGMQLTMYRTYSSDFVSETRYAKNRIQYTDVNKWAVLFTEL